MQYKLKQVFLGVGSLFLFLGLVPFQMIGHAGVPLVQEAPSLSPPWWLLEKRVKAVIGRDSCVKVDDLKPLPEGVSPEKATHFDLNIHVCAGAKAKALAVFMTQNHEFGNVRVNVRVFDPQGQIVPATPLPIEPEAAAEVIQTALDSNSFFVQIHVIHDPFKLLPPVSVEFKAEVVQYFADDISDFYKNRNDIAAREFREVLQLRKITGIKIATSTSRIVAEQGLSQF